MGVDKHTDKLLYGINDAPSWRITVLLVIQQVTVCASGVITKPLIVADLLCGKANSLARVKIIGTSMVVCGIGTFLQTTLGVRLPLLQGPAFGFIPPMVAMMENHQFECPINATDQIFENRMQIVQGSLAAAAVFEILLGFTGIVGLITKCVGPLTITPLMICLEFSAAKFCITYATQHWISIMVVVLLVSSALYLRSVPVPIPSYSAGECRSIKFPVFSLFPYLISISVVWTICAVLTTAGIFDHEKDKYARTDLRGSIISEAPWFRIPYPGQWGPLGFNFGLFLGLTASTVASVTESIGDYSGCAKVCRVDPPPAHAASRGILMEGLACLVGACLGIGPGVTTYSEIIGIIGITKVASRRIMQISSAIFILLGIFTKFGALLATIPDPLVGGVLVVSLATVGGVGLANLESVDLRISRNVAILGIAIFAGVSVPNAILRTPINTGIANVDNLFNILLSMEMFVGGMVGFLLDITVPGATRRQRGFRNTSCRRNTTNANNPYTFSQSVNNLLEKIPFEKFIPFLPHSSDNLNKHLEETLENGLLPETRKIRRQTI